MHLLRRLDLYYLVAGKSIQFREPQEDILRKDALAAVTHRLQPVTLRFWATTCQEEYASCSCDVDLDDAAGADAT